MTFVKVLWPPRMAPPLEGAVVWVRWLPSLNACSRQPGCGRRLLPREQGPCFKLTAFLNQSFAFLFRFRLVRHCRFRTIVSGHERSRSRPTPPNSFQGAAVRVGRNSVFARPFLSFYLCYFQDCLLSKKNHRDKEHDLLPDRAEAEV